MQGILNNENLDGKMNKGKYAFQQKAAIVHKLVKLQQITRSF